MEKLGKDNRGLSLVELLVSVAILSVVLIMAFGFVIVSTNQYHKGNRDANLSNETQLLVARLEDLLLNAGYVTVDASGSTTADELSVYEYVSDKEYRFTHIYPDSTDKKLYYQVSRYKQKADGSWEWTDDAPEVVSDYVDGFTVDLGNLTVDRSVSVTLDMVLKEKSYTTKNTFIFRNKVVSVKNKTEFENLINGTTP
jgi:prepilin-type N-terminal cleavage/methylation domain-containing protein